MHSLLAGITKLQNIEVSGISTSMPCYLQSVARSTKIHSLNNIIPRLSMDINTGEKKKF